MAITVCPVTQTFAAEIGDVDLSQPLAPDDLAAIKDAFATYAVLIFPDQHSQPTSISISRETSARSRPRSRCPQGHEAAPAGRSSPTSPISAPTTRSGGRTAASACTSSATGCGTPTARSSGCRPRLAALRAHDRADRRPHRVRRRARRVRRAARGDEAEARRPRRRALDLHVARRASASPSSTRRSGSACRRCRRCWCARIPQNGPQVALPRLARRAHLRHARRRKAARCIDELIAHATQRQFVYTHRWRAHDLVMWDNRCTMHRGTDYDDLRWTARHAARHGQRRREHVRAGRSGGGGVGRRRGSPPAASEASGGKGQGWGAPLAQRTSLGAPLRHVTNSRVVPPICREQRRRVPWPIGAREAARFSAERRAFRLVFLHRQLGVPRPYFPCRDLRGWLSLWLLQWMISSSGRLVRRSFHANGACGTTCRARELDEKNPAYGGPHARSEPKALPVHPWSGRYGYRALPVRRISDSRPRTCRSCDRRRPRKRIFCPSLRFCIPARSTALMCTNTSLLPSSG